MKAILVDLSKMEVGKRRVGAMSSWVSGTLEMADLPGLLFVVVFVMWEVQWEGYTTIDNR